MVILISINLFVFSRIILNNPILLSYLSVNDTCLVFFYCGESKLRLENIFDLYTYLKFRYFLPFGFEVSAIPRLTRTHYFQRVYGSGWYFVMALNI
jgi:hypothetical protein